MDIMSHGKTEKEKTLEHCVHIQTANDTVTLCRVKYGYNQLVVIPSLVNTDLKVERGSCPCELCFIYISVILLFYHNMKEPIIITLTIHHNHFFWSHLAST